MSINNLKFQTLLVQQEGRVLTVWINDPPFNFMTAHMQRDLDQLTLEVEKDQSIGAVVVTGAPPEKFITHFNIADILSSAEGIGRSISHGAMRKAVHGVALASKLPKAKKLLEATSARGLLNVT